MVHQMVSAVLRNERYRAALLVCELFILCTQPVSADGSPTKRYQLMSLLKWALIFFLISIVAAIFGFGGVAAASADIARVLFYIFVVIFLVLLILGLLAARRV
jgi:uncharacterized membrane protein YtjA (UPF0391 family)